MGFEKSVIEVDAREAAQAGLMAKPLTSLNVQKHLVRGGNCVHASVYVLVRVCLVHVFLDVQLCLFVDIIQMCCTIVAQTPGAWEVHAAISLPACL